METLSQKFVTSTEIGNINSFTLGEQYFMTDNFKLHYWGTYAEIRTGRKYDYVCVPSTDGKSLTHHVLKFEKLTEEELMFLADNIKDINVDYEKRNFQESIRNIWIENEKAGQIVINQDTQINWCF